VATPADPNGGLRKEDEVSRAVDPGLYQSVVGSLLYAPYNYCNQHNSQAIGVVSKYCSKLSEAYLTAAKRILCYLKGTADIS